MRRAGLSCVGHVGARFEWSQSFRNEARTRTLSVLLLLHASERVWIGSGNREAEFGEMVFCLADVRRERILANDATVENSGELSFFVFIVDAGKHHERFIGIAVERIARRDFEQAASGGAQRTFGVIKLGYAEIAFREDFLHVAELLFNLGNQRAGRIFLQEDLKFFFASLGFAAIAIGFFYAVIVGHADLHLGVGAFVGEEGKEGDEIFVFENGLGKAGIAAFFVIRIAERELGLGEIFAIGIGVDQRLEREACDFVAALGDVVFRVLIENLVWRDAIADRRALGILRINLLFAEAPAEQKANSGERNPRRPDQFHANTSDFLRHGFGGDLLHAANRFG